MAMFGKKRRQVQPTDGSIKASSSASLKTFLNKRPPSEGETSSTVATVSSISIVSSSSSSSKTKKPPNGSTAEFRKQWKKAHKGDARAQHWIGDQYRTGLSEGVDQDEKQAFFWYAIAAAQGLAKAQFMFGLCYEKGHGVEEDVGKAIEYYQLAADQGDAFAKARLQGTAMEQYEKNNQEEQEQHELEAKAKESHDPAVHYEMGMFYDRILTPHNPVAVTWYQKAAVQGHVDAQYKLGLCYSAGNRGVPQEWHKAVHWWRQAADQNHAGAHCMLVWCYEQGHGVEQDYDKAISYYQKAAKQGHGCLCEQMGK